MRSLRTTLLVAAGTVVTIAALVWGAGLGAARPHIQVTQPAEQSIAVSYMQGRAARAVLPMEAVVPAAAWSFRDGIPAGWESATGVVVAPAAGTTRFTTRLTSDVQLRSPALSLPTGTYRALLDGSVIAGGLELGEEADDGLACAGGAYFDHSSTSGTRHELPLMFRVHAGKPVRIVLLNWAAQQRASIWQLASLRVVPVTKRRLPPVVRAYLSNESPLVHVDQLPVVNTKLRWEFRRTAGADWQLAPGAHVEKGPVGLMLRTRQNTYGSELTTVVQLVPGPYLLQFEGGIRQGGLMVGALDVARNKWIGQSFYWYGQAGQRGAKALEFTVRRSMNVQLVLGNWAPRAARSEWVMRAVELDQLF